MNTTFNTCLRVASLCLFFLSILPASVIGQLSLHKIFTDHILLQRQKPITIFGKANPGSTIYLTFREQSKKTTTEKDSSWSIIIDPQSASSIPAAISISSGKQKIVIQDVLVGDVWLCIGQSNMEWPMSQEQHYPEEIKNIPSPMLRLYDPVYAGQGVFGSPFSDSVKRSLHPDQFYLGQWCRSDTQSIKGMSAVGYYFGKALVTETGIPIGLVNLAIGGAPIESFISRPALATNFPDKIKGNWIENESLPVWVRQRGKENVTAATNDPSGPDHAFKPGFAFDAGIKHLSRFPIKGIIWYQGESNAQEIERVMEYADLQELMVQGLRANWKDTSLGFYYVQLSSIDSVKYRSQLWRQFRDEQRKMLNTIPHSGMAISSDHGALHDVHPRNKKIICERLARWALVNDYNKKMIPSGPLPLRAIREDGVIKVFFKYGEGLKAEGELKGFSLNGSDEARAITQGSTVVIHIPKNENPTSVYYGWKPFSNGNLVNEADLPASSFKLSVEPFRP